MDHVRIKPDVLEKEAPDETRTIEQAMELVTTVDWIDSGRVPFDPIISHVYPIDAVQKAMELVSEHKDNPVKVLLDLEP